MTAGAFVTAIGTECGKTHLSAAILRALVARGVSPLPIKPLMSGFDPEHLDDSDAGRLLAAIGRPVTPATVSEICWKSFPEWLAPNVAARRSGVSLPWSDLVAFVRERVRAVDGPVLVEGAGGVMSPLTDTHTNIDLMAELRLPVMLVANNYLGAVSHTLTALDAMDRRGVEVRCIAVSQPRPDAGFAAPMVEELGLWTRLPIVTAGFARPEDGTPGWADDLATRLFPKTI